MNGHRLLRLGWVDWVTLEGSRLEISNQAIPRLTQSDRRQQGCVRFQMVEGSGAV